MTAKELKRYKNDFIRESKTLFPEVKIKPEDVIVTIEEGSIVARQLTYTAMTYVGEMIWRHEK